MVSDAAYVGVLLEEMYHRGLATGIWVKVHENQTYQAGDSSWGQFSGKEDFQIWPDQKQLNSCIIR